MVAVAARAARDDPREAARGYAHGAQVQAARDASYLEAAYRQALKITTLTSNPFPPPEYATLDALEATRGLFLSEWLQSGAALEAALAGYSDAELDAFEGRHPAMGMLSLREFMLFMVYHVAHHWAAIKGRLG